MQIEPSTSKPNSSHDSKLQTDGTITINDLRMTKPKKWLILLQLKAKDDVIKIKADGKIFRIKKNLLVTNSPLFRKILQSSDGVEVSMSLNGVSKFAFQVIKDWLDGKKNILNEENAYQIMDVAERLEMNDLLNHCKQIMRIHGGQDEGTSDSWDLKWSAVDLRTVIRRQREAVLEKQKIIQREKEKKKKEELKLERKRLKEEEKRRKAEEKKRKAEQRIEEKKRKTIEKITRKTPVISTMNKNFNYQNPSTSYQINRDNPRLILSSDPSSTTQSSLSSTSLTSKSRTSSKSITDIKKMKKVYKHKRKIDKY